MNADRTTIDRTLLAVRHVLFEDLGILDQLFRDAGYLIDYLDASVEHLSVERFLAVDLVVILGGPIGVYETERYPFLADELVAIRARLAAGTPLFGICLGAQLIAHASGAAVRATGRTEIGYGPLSMTAEGRASILDPLDQLPVLHWHGDEFAIPIGAERLAETPGFPNQAFRIGDSVLGLQFHLEADPARIEQWLVGHARELAAAGVDPTTIRSDAAAHGPASVARGRAVITEWLASLEWPSAPNVKRRGRASS
ncbi:glutamine amidotransferase [Microbacteriaceae bacterium VKM Ac-2855]|nr:glutamine amidotransferase [Microbacteriaceae bacterium VKM Ac-2855]